MLVTSACEVAVPGISDLLLVLVYQLFRATQISIAQTVASCQLDLGFEPELGLAVRRLNMDVHPGLLARTKGEQGLLEKYRGRTLKVNVKLLFTSGGGSVLAGSVTVLLC